jgi:hypothetical protein
MATTSSNPVSPNTGIRKSSILARFKAVPAVTNEQYDETLRRLEEMGNWPPQGLAFHVAFRSEGNFRVSEIWDSRDEFESFGKRLMPVLSDVGIELSEKPEMLEIHNIIQR